MKFAHAASALIVSFMLAVAVGAAEEKKADEKKADTTKPAVKQAENPLPALFKGLNLSDEQKVKAEELNKEFSAKTKGIIEKMEAVLTDEQKKARDEAAKKAVAAGKKGREISEAVSAALKLTDEQKTKLQEIGKEMAPLQRDFMGKVLALLTPEQQEQLKERFQGKKTPPKSE